MRIMRSMTGREYARQLERRAKAAGISVAELCHKAGIARSTFQRMKAGVVEPSLSTLRSLLRVIERAERQQGKACDASDEILRMAGAQ